MTTCALESRAQLGINSMKTAEIITRTSAADAAPAVKRAAAPSVDNQRIINVCFIRPLLPGIG